MLCQGLSNTYFKQGIWHHGGYCRILVFTTCIVEEALESTKSRQLSTLVKRPQWSRYHFNRHIWSFAMFRTQYVDKYFWHSFTLCKTYSNPLLRPYQFLPFCTSTFIYLENKWIFLTLLHLVQNIFQSFLLALSISAMYTRAMPLGSPDSLVVWCKISRSTWYLLSDAIINLRTQLHSGKKSCLLNLFVTRWVFEQQAARASYSK